MINFFKKIALRSNINKELSNSIYNNIGVSVKTLIDIFNDVWFCDASKNLTRENKINKGATAVARRLHLEYKDLGRIFSSHTVSYKVAYDSAYAACNKMWLEFINILSVNVYFSTKIPELENFFIEYRKKVFDYKNYW